MQISQNGIAVAQHFEDCELEAYPDPASVLGKACTARKLQMRDYRKVPGWQNMSGAPWTIGWGHTGPEVKPGLRWTQRQADDQFRADLHKFETGVSALVRVPLTQGQFDALVSFSYNLGIGNLQQSTLLAMVNARNFDGAAEQFKRWNKAGGKVLRGLVRRRAAEQCLFIGMGGASAIERGVAAA